MRGHPARPRRQHRPFLGPFHAVAVGGSRSSVSSASVTRTPIVRVRRSDSPSLGLAMLSLPASQGVQGPPPGKSLCKT